MKTVIEMAREAQMPFYWRTGEITYIDKLERFAELVRADSRNATLDEIATKIAAMPFGDTAASFAVWIREQKT